jgi:hypothetical protein
METRTIRKCLLMVWMLSCACFLFACGGGGGGGGGGATGNGAPTVTVSGKVSANVVYPGTVRIYGVNADGTLKAPALAEGQTDRDGSYSVSLGGYQGAIVGIAFGRFTDEATKSVIDIPEDKCLHAALPAAEELGKSAVSLHISPVSDLAYLKARATSDFAGNIADSNLAMSNLLGVDIVRTPPVSFDAASLASATTTSDQVRLAILLAAISQLTANASANPQAPTAADQLNALTALAAGITITGGSGQLSPEAAYLLQQAGSGLASNGNTLPVIAAGGSAAQSMLATLATIGSASGTKAVSFRLRTTGSYSGNIYGIAMTVGLPAGFVLRTDVNGATAAGVVTASGVAGVNSRTSGKVTGSTLSVGIISALGFGIGEFATVFGEVPATSTLPSAGTFTPVTVGKIVNADGQVIAGLGVEVF